MMKMKKEITSDVKIKRKIRIMIRKMKILKINILKIKILNKKSKIEHTENEDLKEIKIRCENKGGNQDKYLKNEKRRGEH